MTPSLFVQWASGILLGFPPLLHSLQSTQERHNSLFVLLFISLSLQIRLMGQNSYLSNHRFITLLRFGFAYSARFLNYLLSHHVPEVFIINDILRLLVLSGVFRFIIEFRHFFGLSELEFFW